MAEKSVLLMLKEFFGDNPVSGTKFTTEWKALSGKDKEELKELFKKL